MEQNQEQVITITAEQANQIRLDCQHQIDLAVSLERLHANEDFRKVFLTEYAEKEPVRLVSLLSEASFNMSGKKAEYREDIQERMIGISRFQEFIRNTFRLADQAKNTLDDLAQAQNV